MMCARSRRADGQTGADEAVGRTSGRADEQMGRKRRGRLGGRGRKGCGQLSGQADGVHKARTRGQAEEARTRPSTRVSPEIGYVYSK